MASIQRNTKKDIPEVLYRWVESLPPCRACGCEVVAVFLEAKGLVGICAGAFCEKQVFTPYTVEILTKGVAIAAVEETWSGVNIQRYLFPKERMKKFGFHGPAYFEGYCEGRDLAHNKLGVVHFYHNPFLPCSFGALEGMKKEGIEVVIFSYDHGKKKYIPILT